MLNRPVSFLVLGLLNDEYELIPFSLAHNDSFIYSRNGHIGPAGVVFPFWIKLRQFGQTVAPAGANKLTQSLVAMTTDIHIRPRNCFEGTSSTMPPFT